MQATKSEDETPIILRSTVGRAMVWTVRFPSQVIWARFLAFQTFHGFQRFQMLFGIRPLDRLERLQLLEPAS